MVDFQLEYHDALLTKLTALLLPSIPLLYEDGSIAYYEDGTTPVAIQGDQEIAWTGPDTVVTDYTIIRALRYRRSIRFSTKSGDANLVEINLEHYGDDPRDVMHVVGRMVDSMQESPVSVAGWNHILTEIRQNRSLTRPEDDGRKMPHRRLLMITVHYQKAL